MRPGVRLGVDLGTVRVGIAASDAEGRLAVPVETAPRRSALDRIATIAAERGAVEVVLGLPLSLSGGEGPAATAVRAFAAELSRRIAPISLRLYDERFTTTTASAALRVSMRGNARQRRTVLDQVAAAEILQAALDTERASGEPPGEAWV